MMRRQRSIIMLGVHADSKQKGGIHSVVQIYREAGLFQRWPIHYIGTVVTGSAPAKLRVLVKAISEFLRLVLAGRLALLHAQTSSRASFWRKSLFMTIAFAARRPVILHLHGSEFERFYRDECGPLRRYLVRWILRHVDRVVVLSSQWQNFVTQTVPSARVMKIFNPVPVQSASAASHARTADTLLFLGRFGARKGIFDLLQAMTIVRARFPHVKLRCGGDGDVEGVKSRALQLGLSDCVQVLGWVSGTAKQDELARATLYVLPSYAEGLPMGVLEAMASGLPVVATDVGGVPDAIEDGIDGFMVHPGDIEALADRILMLLGNSEVRDRLAVAARGKVRECFATDKIMAQVEGLYAALGAKPNDPHRNQPAAPGRKASRDEVPA